MGRAERRAKDREETKRERSLEASTRDVATPTVPRMADERSETPDEVARRIYRSGGEPERSPRTKRQVSEKPRKWREGRQ